jgi:hypothetical protein
MLIPALALVALLVLMAGAYFKFAGRSEPEVTTQQVNNPPKTQDPKGDSPTGGPVTPPGPAEPEGSNEPPTKVPVDPNPDPADPKPITPPEPMPPDAKPGAVRPEVWATSRQHAAAGRFESALRAIDRVKGVPAPQMQEERNRVAAGALQQTLAARRAADDLRVMSSAEYVLGTTRQAQAERDRAAGRFRSAVIGYAEAQEHFQQAINESRTASTGKSDSKSDGKENNTRVTDSGKDTPPVVTPPTPTQPSVDLSTWSNEEARATIAQFCGAFLGRDMGGLNRLWPNMEPGWRTEFREAFATEGELVCVFEAVTIVRTSEEFNATARLLTQLPGGTQRRRQLALTLVPARDHLVIGNIRVR